MKGAQCASNAQWQPTGVTRGNCSAPHASTAKRCLVRRLRATESQVLTTSGLVTRKTDAIYRNFAKASPLDPYFCCHSIHDPGLSCLPWTYHQAFETLSQLYPPSKLNDTDKPPFFQQSQRMAFSLQQRDLELQIICASRLFRAVDH